MQVTCAVSKGDSPLKITWLKDGRPVDPMEAKLHQLGPFYLALQIESASTAHNGNYTCVASNDAAETSRTATLLVHGTLGPATVPIHGTISTSSRFLSITTCTFYVSMTVMTVE